MCVKHLLLWAPCCITMASLHCYSHTTRSVWRSFQSLRPHAALLTLPSLSSQTLIAGALRQGGGAGRYSLPALYVAAASPRLWRPPPAAMAMGAGGATVVSYGGAAGSASVGEQLLAGLLGPGAGGAAAGGGRGTLRALSEQVGG